MTNFFLRQPHHRGGIRQETVVIPEKMCYNPENAVQAQGGSVMPTLVPILADIRSGAEEAPPVPNTTFGMLFACWAIVIVLLAMVVVFMRAKKKDYALAVLPLTLVPFAHIISGVISRFLDSLIFLSFTQDVYKRQVRGMPSARLCRAWAKQRGWHALMRFPANTPI